MAARKNGRRSSYLNVGSGAPESDRHVSSVCFIIIIIMFINCNWVVTRWQLLFYMYTKYNIGY